MFCVLWSFPLSFISNLIVNITNMTDMTIMCNPTPNSIAGLLNNQFLITHEVLHKHQKVSIYDKLYMDIKYQVQHL